MYIVSFVMHVHCKNSRNYDKVAVEAMRIRTAVWRGRVGERVKKVVLQVNRFAADWRESGNFAAWNIVGIMTTRI